MQGLDLSALAWSFREADAGDWLPARVPGCVHLDLRANGRIPDPFWGQNELALQWIEERDWEYRTSFSLPPSMHREEQLELVAEGLDTVATIYVNGHAVAKTANMFAQYRWSIASHLRPGENELRIHFASALEYIRTHALEHRPREYNDPVGRSSVLRKQQCQFGWDWGPRFVTAGIWRGLRIEAFSEVRLARVRVQQEHAGKVVRVTVVPELVGSPTGPLRLCAELAYEGVTVAFGEGPGDAPLALSVREPALWWPNGHGAQPLYELVCTLLDAQGEERGRWSRRIGLRTLELVREPDGWGESFTFRVNGRSLFAKGANWIPAHSFVAQLTRGDYERDLSAAREAHMNMIRVWGGGIYESEDFYDLCDELGLLVWQDFMFACTLYPAGDEFLAEVQRELEHQIGRLADRTCLALFCGNNEVAQLNGDALAEPAQRAGYERLFHELIAEAVGRLAAHVPYVPSSEWRGEFSSGHALGEQRGDTHFWEVWHARKPVKEYERYLFRFCSEFGMQSYSSPATQATFCPPDDANVFGPSMESHQKNRGGNQVILDYVSRLYRFPKDQDALIYLSQLNQAYCMQVGVEHWRRNMPRCMGALYWQLNDCWPVASWSSIEHTGRWKALHHVARRFFAPALVSAHVPGDEQTTIGNYRESTVREVRLYTVYDAPEPRAGRLTWELFHLDGRCLMRGARDVALTYGESIMQQALDLAEPLGQCGRDRVYLRIALSIADECVSEETVFFAPPRFLALPRGVPTIATSQLDAHTFELSFSAPVFLHRCAFELGTLEHRASDNYFELYPNQPKRVRVVTSSACTPQQVTAQLTTRSLVDSYV